MEQTNTTPENHGKKPGIAEYIIIFIIIVLAGAAAVALFGKQVKQRFEQMDAKSKAAAQTQQHRQTQK